VTIPNKADFFEQFDTETKNSETEKYKKDFVVSKVIFKEGFIIN
jgi:hypothetical protein